DEAGGELLTFREGGANDRALALVLACGAGSAAALLPFAPLLAPLVPRCPFHPLTGLPRPLCATTPAGLGLARRAPARAFAWESRATAALVLGGAACLLAPAWLALRGPVPVIALRRRLFVLPVLANWAWLVVRGV